MGCADVSARLIGKSERLSVCLVHKIDYVHYNVNK